MNRYQFKNGGREHVHILDGRKLTGVSSVGSVISRPLTWWSAELAAVECLEAGEKITTIREEYQAAVKSPNKKEAIDALQKKYPIFKKARFAHATNLKETAGKGTDLHELIENYVKLMIADQAGKPQNINEKENPIQSFINWSLANVNKFLWSELYGFSEKYWLGGISDVGAEMNDGGIAVVDIKSSKDAYPTQFWQCAGYDLLISENGGYTKDGDKIFTLEKPITQHVIFPFGAPKPEGVVRFDVDKNREAFLHCLAILRQLQNYEK